MAPPALPFVDSTVSPHGLEKRERKQEKRDGGREFREKRTEERNETETHRERRLTDRAEPGFLVHELLDLGVLFGLLPLEQKVEHFGFLEERERFGLGSLFVERGVDLKSGLSEGKRSESVKVGG